MTDATLPRMSWSSSTSPALLILSLATSCRNEAVAQVGRDPLGPVRCYQLADAALLDSNSAINLCAGAISDAPGRCFARARDQHVELSTQKLVSLCTAATTTEPLECYARLNEIETLTEDQRISYCSTECPLGPPPPETSHPACVEQALRLANLPHQTAGELCAGASSAGPAQCFLAGQDLGTLADSAVVTLCAERVPCQFYNVPPPP